MRGLYKILTITVLVLASCAKAGFSQEAERLFREMYKDCSMNEVLRLSFVGSVDDDTVDFHLESMSDEVVVFPAGFNIKIFSFDNADGKWVEEENNVRYFPLDIKYIVGRNNPETELADLFVPINPAVRTRKILRVIVHGHIYKNGVETEECAGAFADFVFTP